MASPIPDGTYAIRNVQFPGSFIDLSCGLPFAAINAFPSVPTSTNQHWIVKNVGNKQITLENVTVRGFYASVHIYSKGVPIIAFQNPTYWTVKEIFAGVYTLSAQGFQLVLTEGSVLATIYLGPLPSSVSPGEQQWKFVPLS